MITEEMMAQVIGASIGAVVAVGFSSLILALVIVNNLVRISVEFFINKAQKK